MKSLLEPCCASEAGVCDDSFSPRVAVPRRGGPTPVARTGRTRATPDEVYFARHPANRKPRFEPRRRWPRASPCAKPWALVRDKPGVAVELDVEFHASRRHLPIVRANRVA